MLIGHGDAELDLTAYLQVDFREGFMLPDRVVLSDGVLFRGIGTLKQDRLCCFDPLAGLRVR